MEVLEPENLQNLFSLYESLGVAGIGPVLLRSPYYTVIQTPGSDWPNMAFGIDETKFGDQVAGNIARDMTALGLRPTMILPNGAHWGGILRSCGFLPVDLWIGMSYDRIGEGLFDAVNGERAAFILYDERDFDSWTATVSETLFGGRPLDSGIFRWLHNRGAEMVGMRIGDEMAGST
ncbi:MAG TPA: hypothetical protein VHW43_01385, partial [Puia sp.]|nr:hypothetical protein [Puia sp.]